MVIRVFVSGMSGNKEVKKRQQRVTMILDGKNIEYNVIDIAEPGHENEKAFMQENSKPRDSKHSLPPQIFNDDHYCGDYEDFDMANELDELEKFLNLSRDKDGLQIVENGIKNGSKIDSDCKDLLKEDIREGTSETVVTVSKEELEAVLEGNENETSDPGETPITLDDSSKDSHDPPDNPDESDESLTNDLSDKFPQNGVSDLIPKTDEDEVSKELVEHESLTEENVISDSKNEEDSLDDDTDSED